MRGWAVSLLLAGCTVGPDFKAPVVEAPSIWTVQSGGGDVGSVTVPEPVRPEWWRSFGDAELTSLVERLAGQNLDLQAATERIVQGRAERQVALSQGLPRIDERSSYSRQRVSPTGTTSLLEPKPGAPLEFDLFRNGLLSSWQLDLFGRVRRAVEAADAQTLAAVENRRGVAVSVLAELADDYLRLRGIQARLAIAEGNLRLARENARLVQNRFANGVATTLDTAQAQSQVATVSATVPPLRSERVAAINAIGRLLALPPRALEAELAQPAAIPQVPAIVPVGLPGSLVRRRPDVLEAEARLHEATARTGVAVANFYPDVSLNGMASLEGLRLRDAFTLPSRAFEVGPSISIPLFQGGRLTGELRLREAQQREAAIGFQRAVLVAWEEVDNALAAYAEAQRRRLDVAEAVRQNEAALAASRQRYTEGVSDFLNVNAAQASLLQSQIDLADVDTRIATGLVAIYRALGGGWEIAEAEPR